MIGGVLISIAAYFFIHIAGYNEFVGKFIEKFQIIQNLICLPNHIGPTMWSVVIVCMVVGILTLLGTILAICGAINESSRLILIVSDLKFPFT